MMMESSSNKVSTLSTIADTTVATRELERRLGRVVGEVEARVSLCEEENAKKSDDGEGNENERRRLVALLYLYLYLHLYLYFSDDV